MNHAIMYDIILFYVNVEWTLALNSQNMLIKLKKRKRYCMAFCGSYFCADWCLEVRREPGVTELLCGFTEKEFHNDTTASVSGKSHDGFHVTVQTDIPLL